MRSKCVEYLFKDKVCLWKQKMCLGCVFFDFPSFFCVLHALSVYVHIFHYMTTAQTESSFIYINVRPYSIQHHQHQCVYTQQREDILGISFSDLFEFLFI